MMIELIRLDFKTPMPQAGIPHILTTSAQNPVNF